MGKSYFSNTPFLVSEITSNYDEISHNIHQDAALDNWQHKAKKLQARRWRKLAGHAKRRNKNDGRINKRMSHA